MRDQGSTGSSLWTRSKLRFLDWRNRLLGSPKFQAHAARNPLLRPIARRRARELFDLVSGFTYTQTLLATVETGLLDRLAGGAATLDALSDATGLSRSAADRLARAAMAIGIAQEAAPGLWTLGRHGAALAANEGALVMIQHHRLLYADLADPSKLLRADRAEPTELSRFWTYASRTKETASVAASTNPYSRLMRASQAAVAAEALVAFPFDRYKSLLDVGGGTGAFLSAVGERHQQLRLGLFDLPDVVDQAKEGLAGTDLSTRIEFFPGSFHDDPIPAGFDVVSLVRILHDHDDEPALNLLRNIRSALADKGRLLIVEPMAETPGAEAMGGTYFGLYLWAMGSGRPRSHREIHEMLRAAGYRRSRSLRTDQPLIASAIVAFP